MAMVFRIQFSCRVDETWDALPVNHTNCLHHASSITCKIAYWIDKVTLCQWWIFVNLQTRFIWFLLLPSSREEKNRCYLFKFFSLPLNNSRCVFLLWLMLCPSNIRSQTKTSLHLDKQKLYWYDIRCDFSLLLAFGSVFKYFFKFRLIHYAYSN